MYYSTQKKKEVNVLCFRMELFNFGRNNSPKSTIPCSFFIIDIFFHFSPPCCLCSCFHNSMKLSSSTKLFWTFADGVSILKIVTKTEYQKRNYIPSRTYTGKKTNIIKCRLNVNFSL